MKNTSLGMHVILEKLLDKQPLSREETHTIMRCMVEENLEASLSAALHGAKEKRQRDIEVAMKKTSPRVHAILEKLLDKHPLSREETHIIVRCMVEGNLEDTLSAALLVALRCKGETAEEIEVAASTMLDFCIPVPHGYSDLVDNCGTGGDGFRTFNISTTASFIASGAGVRMAKHGNRSVSSACGSADVLEYLGVNIHMSPQGVARCIQEVGIGFMYAPDFHPSMRHIAPVRKILGTRTIFNILGPLASPAKSEARLIGVYHPALMPKVARAAAKLGVRRVLVVHSEDGMDEMSPYGVTYCHEIIEGKERIYDIDGRDLGFIPQPKDSLKVEDVAESARLVRAVLEGQEGAPYDAALLNAAATIYIGKESSSLEQGLLSSRDAIDSGKARCKLEELVVCSHAQKAC